MKIKLTKVLKIFLWISGALLFLLAGIFIFIQTDTFNRLALNYAVDKLNESWEQKDSRISVNSLKGNIFSGLILDSGYIITDQDTILKFNSIDIKYDVWGLLDHQIRLDNVVLNTPVINLTGVKDSTENLIWNFSRLFSTSSETDTASSSFDWDITLNKLKIENGYIRTKVEGNDIVLSAKESIQRKNKFDPENLIISDLNLELNGKYFRDSKKISLNNFSFNSNSGINIKNFAFDAGIDIKDTVTEINGLEIITDRSNIKLNKIVISSFNPFDSSTFSNLSNKDLEADVNIENINFSELKYFVPEADILDSTAGIELKAKGNIGDLNISGLKLTLPNSSIRLNGKVKNLDDISNLYLDVKVDIPELIPGDIKTILKTTDIPDLSQLGKIEAQLKFTGTRDKFFSEYEVYTNSGNAKGSIETDLNAETYSGNIKTFNLNIGKILKNKDLQSDLNLYTEFSGKGFDLNSMTSSVKYSISRSAFAGYDIRNSSGKIYISRKNIDLNISNYSSFGNIKISGKVNISDMNTPVYAIKGSIRNFDISRLTKNSEDKSDLNLSFDINGRGSSLNNISGNYNFDLDKSYYGQNQIPETPLNIEIRNSKGYSSFSLTSDFADFNAKGNFNIESLSGILSRNIEIISAKFKEKLIPDSAVLIPAYRQFTVIESEDFDMTYELTMKDTSASNRLLKPFGILFDGNISGSASNYQQKFSLSSKMNVNKFSYQDTVIVLKDFRSELSFANNFQNTVSDNSLSSVDMKLILNGDQIILSNSVFDSVKAGIDMANDMADFNISAKQDSGISAYLKGRMDLSSSLINADFDSVRINYGSANITNEKNWLIGYLPGQKINFSQVAVRSRDLVVNIKGNYEFNGMSDLKIESKDVSLEEIYSLLAPQDTSKIIVKNDYPVKGMITDLSLSFKGNTDAPELTADITTGKLKYKDINEEIEIGDMSIKVDYKNESAATDISLNNANNKGSLKIKGNIPFRNPLKASDSLSETDLAGKSVDLKLTAKDFQLKYFLKLIPSLPDISGFMNGGISATGDASSPDLKGSIAVKDGDIYFSLTGMNYKYNLNTSTENSKLVINKLSLSSQGDAARHFDIFGNIDFSGMKINDIDLNTSGDMVFLDKDVSQDELGVYGYLRGGSGTPSLKIKGNPDKLSVTGQFLIIDATISSIPLGGSGYDNKVDNFTYISVSDTSANYVKDTLQLTEPSDFYKINPFARYKYTVAGKERTAADFLDMDINVKTQKNIYVSIDFDNITKDRLFGEITADLKLKTEDNEFQATGDVNIVNNSYYRFYKDFKLKNSKISFNGPISNPLLDIQAVYEGVKNTQQFGTVASTPVNVMLTLKGELDNPRIELKLIEDGTVVSGSDAQADAITFLLFGKYKSELSTSERTAVASSLGTSLGSLYISSIVSQTVRDILPFLIDAQFKYSDGSINDTEVELTSELGEATIKVGGKLLKEIRNFEFVIDYPLNGFLNLNLPETLLLEFSREEENNVIFGSSETTTNTGLKIVYRIKY
jgi:hypothetical protein